MTDDNEPEDPKEEKPFTAFSVDGPENVPDNFPGTMFSQITSLTMSTGELVPVVGPDFLHHVFDACMQLTRVDAGRKERYQLDPEKPDWVFNSVFRTAIVEFKAPPNLMLVAFDLRTGVKSFTGPHETPTLTQTSFETTAEMLDFLTLRATHRAKQGVVNPILKPPKDIDSPPGSVH